MAFERDLVAAPFLIRMLLFTRPMFVVSGAFRGAGGVSCTCHPEDAQAERKVAR